MFSWTAIPWLILGRRGQGFQWIPADFRSQNRVIPDYLEISAGLSHCIFSLMFNCRPDSGVSFGHWEEKGINFASWKNTGRGQKPTWNPREPCTLQFISVRRLFLRSRDGSSRAYKLTVESNGTSTTLRNEKGSRSRLPGARTRVGFPSHGWTYVYIYVGTKQMELRKTVLSGSGV